MQSQADPGQIQKVLADVQNMRNYIARLNAWQESFGYKGMHPALRGAVADAEKTVERLAAMLGATLIGRGQHGW